MSELDDILAEIEAGNIRGAARDAWNPVNCGEIDIRIGADGSWYHEGRRFQRDALVKLFAGVLRREKNEYFLVTPVEKLRIEVEDAPFVAGLVEVIEDRGRQAIVFTTNIGERIVLDEAHPLRIETDADSGEPRPYIWLRDGLEALISRGAFFELANLAERCERDGRRSLCVTSLGKTFELGSIEDE